MEAKYIPHPRFARSPATLAHSSLLNSYSSLIAPRNNTKTHTKTSGLAKCNPLAYWTLEDCFDYISKYKVPHHPCHAQGYPSHGDAKDTIPIPR